ncbi:23S rRNA (guanosine(2251)-2'-O)-methyltransferase RlmB [Thermoproteota archaeon]
MSKNTMMLYGKNSVLQRLKRNPRTIKKIFLDEAFNDGYILTIVTRRKIPIIRKRNREFLRIKRADRLQGIIAEVQKYEYVPFKDLLGSSDGERLTLIFLDGLNDPHNLGSIMRTLACFGGFAIVIPKHGSCEVNDTVMHVATGGENFVPVAVVTNISIALRDAKKAGYWVAGSVVEGGQDIGKVELPFPLCLVLGSEGKGIRPGTENNLDLKVTLPMTGAKLSFNVGIACAIFCHEIKRQHGLRNEQKT